MFNFQIRNVNKQRAPSDRPRETPVQQIPQTNQPQRSPSALRLPRGRIPAAAAVPSPRSGSGTADPAPHRSPARGSARVTAARRSSTEPGPGRGCAGSAMGLGYSCQPPRRFVARAGVPARHSTLPSAARPLCPCPVPAALPGTHVGGRRDGAAFRRGQGAAQRPRHPPAFPAVLGTGALPTPPAQQQHLCRAPPALSPSLNMN